MKNLTLQLENPPQGVYFPGMTVYGVVIVENDTEPMAYRAIEVVLNGGAHVHWTSIDHDDSTINHDGDESYIQSNSVLWDKDRDAAGGMYPVGTYHYQFSFQLVAPKLPPNHKGDIGHISYKVVATIQKEGVPLKSSPQASVPITVANAVAISHPSLLQPRSKEVQKTLSCLCCASGPIVITATVPRTGYCAGCDSIPLEVTIENGSSRTVRQLVAAIVKNVIYKTNEGETQSNSTGVTSMANDHVIEPHTTLVWKPNTFNVPYTETTLEICASKVTRGKLINGQLLAHSRAIEYYFICFNRLA